MHVREALVIAVHSMRTARLRTMLTALGIVVGVAAVIVLVGLGDGMRDGFHANFGKLSNVIIVTKMDASLPGGTPTEALRESEYQALVDANQPDIAQVTPFRNGVAVIKNGNKQYRAGLAGASEAYLDVRNRTVLAGRMFTDQENEDKARVVVLGTKIVEELFDGDANAAVGSEVRIGRLSMKVVGVLASAGDDQDGTGLVPLNSSRALFAGSNTINGIGVTAVAPERVSAAIEQIRQVLDPLRKVEDAGSRDYNTSSMVAQISRIDRYITLVKWFTVSVALIALFIGALGLANIMLVTVTERTSEIGIRKAIGARNGAIVKQFLIESTLLSAFGGLFGVGVGVGLTLLGKELLPRYAPGYGAPEVSLPAVGVAFGASLLIGVIAGSYPALRAALLHPIDALRY